MGAWGRWKTAAMYVHCTAKRDHPRSGRQASHLVRLARDRLPADWARGRAVGTGTRPILLVHLAGARWTLATAHAIGTLGPTLLVSGTRRLGSGAGTRAHRSTARRSGTAIWRHGATGWGLWPTAGGSPGSNGGLGAGVTARRPSLRGQGPLTARIIGSSLRVHGRASRTAILRWPRLHGTRRQAGPWDDTLLRPVEADAKSLQNLLEW